MPDNDDAGRQYVADILAILTTLVPTPTAIATLLLPGLPDGGDIVDFIATRGGGQ
ncbi:MAG: hypothetical protein HKP50_11900 [Myxococcales bacterium]|nr:hypothetical protein [Myxococcales bacterium]